MNSYEDIKESINLVNTLNFVLEKPVKFQKKVSTAVRVIRHILISPLHLALIPMDVLAGAVGFVVGTALGFSEIFSSNPSKPSFKFPNYSR